MTGKQYSAKLQLSNELLGEIRDKFGDVESDFRRAAGYGFDRLTESEARALVRFRPADAIRSRIVAEAHEKGQRVDEEGTGQGLTLGSSEGPESAAVQAALDKLPEKFRMIFEDIEGGASPSAVMARNNVTEKQLTNILDRVRLFLSSATYPGRDAGEFGGAGWS